MRVSDVMTQASIVDAPFHSLRAAAERMWSQQTGSLLIVEDEHLVGIITERDILHAVARGTDVDGTAVKDAMTSDPFTVTPDTPLRDAAREMAVRWIRHLPVVDDGRIAGVVSQRDVTGIFAALSKDPGSIELEFEPLVRERRLARIDHGDLD